jgi:hypothetical protein
MADTVNKMIRSDGTFMQQKTIELMPGERIVAVVPEHADGPGWSNTPVMVYIATNDGRLRDECIQPEEQTAQMRILYHIGEMMCRSLIAAVPQRRVGHNKTATTATPTRQTPPSEQNPTTDGLLDSDIRGFEDIA